MSISREELRRPRAKKKISRSKRRAERPFRGHFMNQTRIESPLRASPSKATPSSNSAPKSERVREREPRRTKNVASNPFVDPHCCAVALSSNSYR